MSLSDVLKTHRVVVTVGSGGVGKTTTAAALATRAAMEGRKVLCLTIDPARRLANSLGLDQMTTSEQEVPAALFEAQGLELRGELSAMMLDTRRTFDELVAVNAESPEARDRILNNQIYNYVAGSLAGTQEYMAMEKLYSVRQNESWDLIVLDTPPTGNALDFLDAPERLVGAIDSPAMRWFIQAFDSSRTGGAFDFVGRGAAVVFKGLARFTGVEFLEQVAEFIAGLNSLFGGFKERAGRVSAALRSPEVAFIVVTSPDPMAIQEASYFSDRLRDAGMRRDGVVINGMHSLLPEPEASEDELVRSAASALPSDFDAADTVRRMRRALDDERLMAVADRVEAERLRTQVGTEVVFVEVPALEEDVHDLLSLSKVADHLTGRTAAEVVAR